MILILSNRHLIPLLTWIISSLSIVKGSEYVLLDTREAMSDLGWAFSSLSRWQEMSDHDKDGIERRVFQVCEVTKRENDNWLRSEYIQVLGAERVYVEIAFTMRSCDGVSNVATCKETFNMYYYETDSDEGTSTYPPWNEQTYIKVDTIAADIRWSHKNRNDKDKQNVEVRDIGPLTKRGFYLAIQDTGSCISLNYVRVYYKYCEAEVQRLASFGRTITGAAVISLVETKGTCVKEAVPESETKQPTLYCDGKGNWTVPSNRCLCRAGYQANHNHSACEACARGSYKSEVSLKMCQRCPPYSVSESLGMTKCSCMHGYYRASSHGANKACTKPPNKPASSTSNVNETSIILNWQRPLYNDEESTIYYNITCQQCSIIFRNCHPCSDHVNYSPSKNRLLNKKVIISQLQPHSQYKLRIYAVNDVTEVAQQHGENLKNFIEINVATKEARPTAIRQLASADVSATSFIIKWISPAPTNGFIEKYEVIVTWSSKSGFQDNTSDNNHEIRNYTSNVQMKFESLQPATRYSVKVRAKTIAGYGPFNDEITVETKADATIGAGLNDKTGPNETNNESSANGANITLIAILIGGVVVIIIFIVVGLTCTLRRVKPQKSSLVNRHEDEKQPFFNGNSIVFGGSMYQPNHKTYIDPTTYEDPNRAVRDFTKEIDATYVKIEQVIGGGEFGEVCRGRLQLPGKSEHDVAIKTLKSGYSTQQKLDFLGEASIMGQFEYPNVIRLEGVVTRSRPLMIITEFMENGSLDSFLRVHDNEFTIVQLVGMLRNVSAGMKYLSDMGYIHRDLAARNILVNAQLICKVSDFGMSRVLEDDTDVAYTARHGGKIPIRWTAPEAFTFRKFTSASDVWSFGIVMWEVMSYGERPYWGMSNRDVMNAVETGYRLPAPMDCPQVQHALMLDCWKKDRNQRPKFSQIVATLDKMLRDPSQLKVKAGHDRKRSSNTLNASNPSRNEFTTQSSRPMTQQHHQVITGTSVIVSDSGYNGGESSEENRQIMLNDRSSISDFLETPALDKYSIQDCSDQDQTHNTESLSSQSAPSMMLESANQERGALYSQETHTERKTDEDCSLGALPSYSESHRLTGIPV